MNINSRTSKVNFIGNAAGAVASFTAYRSSKASILIDDHYFTPADNKANVCNTPMPVSPLWTIDSSFNGHVEFNQLCNFSRGSSTVKSVEISRDGNGKVTLNGTCDLESGSANALIFPFSSSFIDEHKYLVGAMGTRANHLIVTPNGASYYIGDFRLFKTNFNLVISIYAGETYNNESIYPMIIDLTQMFGSTIADYIYTLEQGEAGAGVTFFRSIYPNDYYDYDTGTDEMVGSREGSIITLPIDIKTSFIPNIGSNNIFADCGYVDVYYVTV